MIADPKWCERLIENDIYYRSTDPLDALLDLGDVAGALQSTKDEIRLLIISGAFPAPTIVKQGFVDDKDVYQPFWHGRVIQNWVDKYSESVVRVEYDSDPNS